MKGVVKRRLDNRKRDFKTENGDYVYVEKTRNEDDDDDKEVPINEGLAVYNNLLSEIERLRMEFDVCFTCFEYR